MFIFTGCSKKDNIVQNESSGNAHIETTESQIVTDEDIISFSVDSGFYEEEFYLELISTNNADIYYTLDGSVPDNNSLKYTGSILISDATQNDNVYSARDDVSTGFLEAAGKVFKVPDYLVDKATIVRAVAYNEAGQSCKVVTGTYFVGYNEKEEYENMAVLSIVADPDDLFDYESGIYVTGKYYDEYEANGRGQWFDAFWWWWTSNYSQEGRDWEKEADITIFNENGEIMMSTSGGIRIQGGGSRGQAQKSFNIYSRKEYSDSRRFKSDIFGTGYMPHKFTVFAGGDDVKYKIKDYLLNNILEEMNFSTMDFVPCSVFLNGEYWGMYYITEKYDSDYIEFHYGIDKDDVIMIKNNGIEEGEEAEIEIYKQNMKFVEENDMSLDENYAKACELFDMDSTIDYFAALIYAGRHNDWPLTNTALWRSRSVGNGEYQDGRWRWMLFDVNSGGLDEYIRGEDTIWTTRNYNAFFNSLFKNDDFKEKFSVRIMDIGNGLYSETKIDKFIDDWYNKYEKQLKSSYIRYSGEDNSDADIAYGINSVRNFFVGRLDVVEEKLAANLAVEYNTAQINITKNEGGDVEVNTITVQSEDSVWIGKYLTEFPIKIKAVSKPGYTFKGWKIEGRDTLVEEEEFVYDWNDGDIYITACFELSEQ